MYFLSPERKRSALRNVLTSCRASSLPSCLGSSRPPQRGGLTEVGNVNARQRAEK